MTAPGVYTRHCAQSIKQQVLRSIIAPGMAVCYVAPVMQTPLHTIDHRRRIMADHSVQPVNVDSVEIRLIRLPLKEAFETSFGRVHSRLIFLVSVAGHGLNGWGEVVAMDEPLYGSETT